MHVAQDFMIIRESPLDELPAIQSLHRDAFGDPEGAVIADLVGELLSDKTATPLFSFVAEEINEIVGHILFSPVTIGGYTTVSPYILAPLAVLPRYQRKGVGTSLITHGLRELRAHGAEFILVLGDPNYYTRTGFTAEHNIEPPYKLPYPEAWMAKELKSGTLGIVSGVAQCASALMAPEHW